MAVLFGAPLIADFFHASEDVGLFRLLALVVAAKGLNQVPSAILRRDMDFRKGMVTSFVRSLHALRHRGVAAEGRATAWPACSSASSRPRCSAPP